VLPLILLLAAGLRLRDVNQPYTDAFSWRQSSTAMMAENFHLVNPNILFPEVNWSGPGPNYQGREFQTVSWLASRIYAVTGQRDWVGRVIAVVSGLVGIAALYGVVRRIWGETHGLLAGFALAVLPGGIAVERSFLPDPAMVALMTLSLLCLLVYLDSGRPRDLVLAAAVGTLGALTKIPGLLVGVPMIYAVVALLRARGRLGRPVLAPLAIAGVVGLTIVAAYYLWARHLSLTYPPYHFAGSANWLWVQGLDQWIADRWYVPRLYIVLQWWMWGAPVLLLALLGALLPPPSPDSDSGARSADARWLVHAWAAGCLVYVLIGANELVTNPWNLHVFSPVAAAFAARAVHWIGRLDVERRSRLAWVPAAAVLALVAASGVHVAGRMTSPENATAGHELGKALRRASQPGDLVLTMADDLGDPVAIFYSRRRGWIFPPPDVDYAWNELPPDGEAIRMLDSLRAQGADWFGMTMDQYGNVWSNHRPLLDHLEDVAEFHSKGESWIVYRLEPVRNGAAASAAAADDARAAKGARWEAAGAEAARTSSR
jgi:4-amino-4-deoxy-L-arabinose transferase-like glycosyltransferase